MMGLFTAMILSFTKKQHIFRNVNKQFISCPKLSLNDLLRPNCLTTISFLFFNIWATYLMCTFGLKTLARELPVLGLFCCWLQTVSEELVKVSSLTQVIYFSVRSLSKTKNLSGWPNFFTKFVKLVSPQAINRKISCVIHL